MEGKGFFRGSSVLVTGTAGTGKSSLAANFTRAACARGELCLYFTFEESPSQILRNMRSVGLDLERWVKKRLLHFNAMRPTSTGLEGHLAVIHRLISQLRPSVVVIDPITNLVSASGSYDVKSMLVRLVDFLKVAADHIDVYESDIRRRSPGENRGGRFLSHGHLDCVAGQQAQRTAETRALRLEIPRHGTFAGSS